MATTKPKEMTISERIAALQSDIEKLKSGLVDEIVNGLSRVELMYRDYGSDPRIWSMSSLPATLSNLGLVPRSGETVKVKKPATELPPVKETPLALKICEYLKKIHKPATAEMIIQAVGDTAKPSTIKNYAARLVGEGVLYRPERGQFAIK